MYCTFWPSALSYACFMRVLPEGTLAVNNVKNVLSGILIGAADKPERGASQRTILSSSCQEMTVACRMKGGLSRRAH